MRERACGRERGADVLGSTISNLGVLWTKETEHAGGGAVSITRHHASCWISMGAMELESLR